jgi:nicotinate-nucleotide--dimethylbenzimidazole phosphoribosyltransferase
MPGTNNLRAESAMSREQAEQAIMVGTELVSGVVEQGIGMIGTGEMGIGNTTASAAITAVMTGRPVEEVTGRGTGIDDAVYRHKISMIKEALAFHRPDPSDALEVLSRVGGLEIAGLVGLILGSALARVPVVLDGFIAGAAALIAARLQPNCLGYMIASHRSVERGHQVLLDHLGLKALLDLDLRLGEGTGACLAMDLVCAAIKIYTEMATFDEAGVSEKV